MEIKVLRKINEEVSELVEANRHLQTKCALLQTEIDPEICNLEVINFFNSLQDKIQSLITFLIQQEMLSTMPDIYNKFLASAHENLATLNFEAYFDQFYALFKGLFARVEDQRSEDLKQKAKEILEMKEQMAEILDKQIEYSEAENFQTLEKYKMIFTDIKFLLR